MESRRIFGGDKVNNITESDKWFKTSIDSMHIESEYPIAVRLPLPTAGELIKILLSSSYNDEVISSCLLLVDNESTNHVEFRRKLLNELKKINIRRLDRLEKKRIETIIILTELNHSENRREILGKSAKQVEKDYQEFSEIADEADKILRQTKLNFFQRIFKLI